MPEAITVGSYRQQDVILLFAELGDRRLLPAPEYRPEASYLASVRDLIGQSAPTMALLCATLAELILARRGPEMVLVSIARAGTPVGVLLRSWLRYYRRLEIPHYTLALTQGFGLDLNAVDWICRRHAAPRLQFVDAWTSKGTVRTALRTAPLAPGLDPGLAVLSDVGLRCCWSARRPTSRPRFATSGHGGGIEPSL